MDKEKPKNINDTSESEEEEDDQAEIDDPLDVINWNNLPEHTCSYCGIHRVDVVVKCGGKSCNKWFCNGRGINGMASHIVVHLVKSKHKEITVHPKSKVGETALECFICGNRNVFLLGITPILGSEGDQVIILCRLPCLAQKKYSEYAWEPQDWTSLIEEKQIVNWLVNTPSEKLTKLSRQITQEEINYMEDKWKTHPEFKLADIALKQFQKPLRDVLLTYEDGKHYCKIFYPLVEKEAEYDKQVKEQQTQSNITIRWDFNLKNKRLAYFQFAQRDDFEGNLLPGNELKLSVKPQNHPAWSSKGVVLRMNNTEEVCLEVLSHDPPPPVQTGYTVEFVWKNTVYTRMRTGLRRFWKDNTSISSYLYYRLLGQDPEPPKMDVEIGNVVSAPNLPELNIYQIDAVKKALKMPLCLIQGPPGTGKTITSASIVYHLVKSNQKKKIKAQVLVCAPSNIVTDQLAEKIHLTGVKVVRLCSKSREAVSSNIEFLTLHSQVRSISIPEYSSLEKYYSLLEDQGELNPKDEKEFRKLRDQAERDILESADVICATCITAADPRLKGFKFKHVLIDEATQAIEPEGLLPLLRGAKQGILVGDHRQLGPVITCRQTAKAGLNRSMFERLVAMGIRPLRLQVQYRMHPELTIFPSNTFYEGTLQNGVTFNDRNYEGDFKWPKPSKPMFFISCYGSEEISSSGTSYLNRQETQQIEAIVYHFIKSGTKPQQLGIITPYKGQRAFIVNYLAKEGRLNPNIYKEIEVASVDGFQGREKDFIIISCVRSNEGLGIGFLTDPRRLNVTITRAKFGLIICGNAIVLSKDNLWNNLLNHFKENEVLVEGQFPNLKTCTLKFRQPQKYIPERRNLGNIETASDTESVYDFAKNDNINTFDAEADCPLNQGYRNSEFGFKLVPESEPFKKIQRDHNFKKIEFYGTFNPDQENIFFFGQEPTKPNDKLTKETFNNDTKKETRENNEENKEKVEGLGNFLPKEFQEFGMEFNID